MARLQVRVYLYKGWGGGGAGVLLPLHDQGDRGVIMGSAEKSIGPEARRALERQLPPVCVGSRLAVNRRRLAVVSGASDADAKSLCLPSLQRAAGAPSGACTAPLPTLDPTPPSYTTFH